MRERRERKGELWLGEQRFFESVFNEMNDAIMLASTGEGIIRVNRAFETMFGWKENELLGTFFRDYPFVPKTMHHESEQIYAALHNGGKAKNIVTRRMRKDGTLLDVSVSFSVIADRLGRKAILGVYRDITELKTRERQLEESEQRFKSLFEHHPDAVIAGDLQGRFVAVNRSAAAHVGITAEELGGMSLSVLVHPDDAAEADRLLTQTFGGSIGETELRVRTPNGYSHFRITSIPIYVGGAIQGLFGIARDITAVKKAQHDLVASEERHRKLVELSPDPIVVHRSGRLLYWNRAAAEYMGALDAGDLHGRSVVDFIDPAYVDQVHEVSQRINVTGESKEPAEIVLRRFDGTTFHAELVGTRLEYDAQPASLVMIRDVTKRKQSELLIEYMAYHDALTGLPNRVRFRKQALEKIAAGTGTGAIYFIDLDRFKLINDTLGHRVGDMLLKEVSERLKRFDNLIVSRQGGDEFAAFGGVSSREEAAAAAERLIAALSEPYDVGGNELFVTPSVGASLYPQDSEDIDMLLQQADTALYVAKANGGSAYAFYDTEAAASNSLKMALTGELRKALANGEFAICYQPKYDVRQRSVVGAEALLRWNHPTRGSIPPDQFIPFAEESGLILPIGDWVLRTACRQAKAWHDAGFPIDISVNISVRQFLQRQFVEGIDSALAETGLNPSALNLEITESVPVLDLQAAVQKLNRLREAGVTISLDDFGTGYSSLNYIRLLPYDFLKIDRSFVQNMHEDPFHASIVRSVISIAHMMGKRVVAEGVETREHLDLLEQSACDEVQGFYFSRPIAAEPFERLLRETGVRGAP